MIKKINDMKEDHRSYRRNSLQLRKESLKKVQACTGIRTLDLCDTGAALKPIELISQLGAGR